MSALYSEPSMNTRPRVSFEAFRPRHKYAAQFASVKGIKGRGHYTKSSNRKQKTRRL